MHVQLEARSTAQQDAPSEESSTVAQATEALVNGFRSFPSQLLGLLKVTALFRVASLTSSSAFSAERNAAETCAGGAARTPPAAP